MVGGSCGVCVPEVVGGVAIVEFTEDVNEEVINDREVNKSPPLSAPKQKQNQLRLASFPFVSNEFQKTKEQQSPADLCLARETQVTRILHLLMQRMNFTA